VQALRAAQHCRQCLERDPHDVILWLLRGQGAARRLCMEAHAPRSGVLCAKSLAHDPRPEPSGCSELGHLFQQVVVGVEEEAQPVCKVIYFQPCVYGCLDIGDGVGQGEGHLLHCRRACFADVVAADADGVPSGHAIVAVGECIRDEAHGGARRKDIRPSGHVLFENVVLDGAAQRFWRDALLFGHGDIHGQQHCRRRVDGHGRAHFVQGDAVKEAFHVLQRRDGDADFAHFALCHRVVCVVANLCRQVERYREASLALGQQKLVAGVGLLGGGIASVLAHRPKAPAVHGGLHPPREGILTRKANLVQVIGLDVGGCVEALHGDVGQGLEGITALWVAAQRFFQGGLLPLFLLLRDLAGYVVHGPPRCG